MRLLVAICSLTLAANSAWGAAPADRSLDGAWVLSGKWAGYMGLALKIDGHEYKYWFSSDVGPTTFETTINGRMERHTAKRPKYPLRGRLIVHGDVLELRGPGDYYDRKWHRMTHRGVPCLLADTHYREWKRSGRLADDRLLFRLSRFNERKPQLNYGGFKRSDGTTSPSASCFGGSLSRISFRKESFSSSQMKPHETCQSDGTERQSRGDATR